MRITLFFIFLASFAVSPNQEVNRIQQIEGVYMGRVEGGYSFCCKTALGKEEVVVFDQVLSIILERYPLDAEEHVGKNFMISFTKRALDGKDGREEISTILRLQPLNRGQHL